MAFGYCQTLEAKQHRPQYLDPRRPTHFWSMLKRGYHGTNHRMSEKHLDRYVAEFSDRHNACEADTADQIAQLVAASVGKRLMYRDLIA